MLKRRIVQITAAVTTNSYFKGFLEGTVYKGKSKVFCVPGLNCYSCPGSLGSCPIGAFQAVANSAGFFVSYYLIGFFLIIGTLLGRFVCGWLCPFGLIQEVLYKIPVRKIHFPRQLHFLKYFKYLILLIFVIYIPIFVINTWGIGYPAFCKWICPAGTLEAGIPLIIVNESIRSAAGALFTWKIAVLIFVIILSVKLNRFFCKFMCPLGAIYAIFNKVSIFRLNINTHKCIKCGKCSSICKMDVSPFENPNSLECIRCGECRKACPSSAIRLGIK